MLLQQVLDLTEEWLTGVEPCRRKRNGMMCHPDLNIKKKKRSLRRPNTRRREGGL
jgi:hypothetical protein